MSMNKNRSIRFHFSFLLLFTFIFQIQARNYDPFFISLKNVPHHLTVMNGGMSALDHRFDLIKEAKETIDIEYLIFRRDLVGQMFIHALLVQAREKGVKVRLLLDYFLVKSHIDPFLAYELENNGIEVKYYNTAPTLLILKVQYRNHRKTLIVDKKKAIIGGRNIGNEYFDLDHEYNFHDRDVLIEGPIVQYISETFEIVWNSDPVKKVFRERRPLKSDISYRSSPFDGRRARRDYRADLRRWQKKVNRALKWLNVPKEKFDRFSERVKDLHAKNERFDYSGVCHNLSFASDRPGVGKETRKKPFRVVKYEVYRRLALVEKKVIIDSPYFIVDGESVDVLEALASKNVDVTVLTNGLYSTDAIYVSAVLNSTIDDWLDAGFKFYISKGEHHQGHSFYNSNILSSRWGTHSKNLIFDDDSFMLGSYNFDPHSENYNLEMAIFCDGQEDLTRKMNDYLNKILDNNYDFIKDIETAREQRFNKIGFFKKMSYFFIKVPSLLLDHLL